MFEEQIATFNKEQAAQETDGYGWGRGSSVTTASAWVPSLDRTPREPQRMTYTVAEVQQMLGIGETSAYKLCNSGAFKVLRIGNSIRISRPSFDKWLEAQL